MNWAGGFREWHRAGGFRERHGRVVVVGDLVTDVLAVLPGPIARLVRGRERRPAERAEEVPAAPGAGQEAMDLAPGSDTPARIRVTGGGQAANTAAWLARCGVPVTLVATVGDDPPGRERVAELTAAGVDCAVRRVAGVPTGTLVVLSTGEERSMLSDRGAADHLREGDVDAALSPDVRHLHLSGYALLGDGSRAAGRHALAAARTRGLSTSVDAASAGPLRRAGAAAFIDWVRGVDLLFANADEAAILGNVAAALITHSPTGARWTADTVTDVPTSPATVVDPTGAGDAFAAGLLAAWLAGASPADALRAGNRLGAEAVGGLGPRPGPGPGPATDRCR